MSRDVIKSAGRALAVLELFERERAPLGLGQLTAALSLPTSSGAALMKSLVELGYLSYDRARRRYFPTMRIAVLGGWIEQALFGAGGVVDRAERLHEATGLTVVLAARSDLDAQYLHLIHDGTPLSLPVAPGELRPLARSGMGWLLLGALTDREVRGLVRRIDYRTPGERTDLHRLMQRLHATRRDGYAFSRDQVSPGYGVVGALLPQQPGARGIAIGVTGRTEQLEQREKELIMAVRRSAEAG